jgi:hypothetical protein
LVLLGFFVQSMNAQILEDRNFAVGINAGTNGFGGELTTNVTKKFNARIGFNLLNISENGSYDDEDPGLDYNADLGVSNFSALVDFFPMNRGFKLTAGFYYYNFEVTGDAIPNENYIMNEGRDNEKVFTPDRLGSLAVRLEYPNKFMPYIGLGFGNAISPKGIPVKFNMQLGMLYSGAPELAMTGTGMIAPTVDQAPNIQAGLNAFEWLPVINLGLSVRIK